MQLDLDFIRSRFRPFEPARDNRFSKCGRQFYLPSGDSSSRFYNERKVQPMPPMTRLSEEIARASVGGSWRELSFGPSTTQNVCLINPSLADG